MSGLVEVGDVWRNRRMRTVVDVRLIESDVVYFLERPMGCGGSASLEAFIRLYQLVSRRPERAQGADLSESSGDVADGRSRAPAPSPAEGGLARETAEALDAILQQGLVEAEVEADGEVRIRLTEAGMAYYEERFGTDARDRLR